MRNVCWTGKGDVVLGSGSGSEMGQWLVAAADVMALIKAASVGLWRGQNRGGRRREGYVIQGQALAIRTALVMCQPGEGGRRCVATAAPGRRAAPLSPLCVHR